MSDALWGLTGRLAGRGSDGASPPPAAPPDSALAEPPATSPPVTAARAHEMVVAPIVRSRGVVDVAAAVVASVAPGVIERVDIHAVIDRVDVDRVLGRVDIDTVLARVDLDAVADRIDMNRLLERIDIGRLVQRLDLGTVAQQAVEGIDLGEIVRDSTLGLGGETVRDARLQAMRADRAVQQAVDRVRGRDRRAGVTGGGAAMTRAGVVSRAMATLIDAVVVIAICLVMLVGLATLRLLWDGRFNIDFVHVITGRAVAIVVLVGYLAYGWGLNGRTIGKVVMGLQVVRADGGDLSFRRALARAILSVVFPVGLLWAVVSERAASVQDVLLGTAVIHDWGRAGGPVARQPQLEPIAR